MYLMPQLPTPFAEVIAREFCSLRIAECRERRALDHTNRIYTPTGGRRIPDRDYAQLRDRLSALAETAGYPKENAGARARFDVDAAIFLHREFKVTENEAAKGGIWNFLSCVALPDLVRWRWQSGGETSLDRFLSGHRNTFERLWKRSHAYFDTGNEDPYWLVREIGEDESVGMMERTTLCGVRPFVVSVLRALLECYRSRPLVARSELMRDAMKRFRRLGGLIALEALSKGELSSLCQSVFAESSRSLAPPREMVVHDAGRPGTAASRATKLSDKSRSRRGVSLEDLAWLEVEMKRNQGRSQSR